MSYLVPKSVVRSDGVLTTVHVNLDKGATADRSQGVSAPSLVQNTRLSATFDSGIEEINTTVDAERARDRTPLQFPGLLVMSGENVWRVSEGSRHNEISGSYCKICGEWLDIQAANEADTDWVECSECENFISNQDGVIGIGIIEDDAALFGDTNAEVKARTWYHSTNHEDWAEKLQEVSPDGTYPFGSYRL